jgi:hypothetical protein
LGKYPRLIEHLGKLRGAARLAFSAALAAAALASAAAAARAALHVQIVNQTGRPDRSVFVMLTGGSSGDGRMVDKVPVRLSAIARSGFSLDRLGAGRIFFSFGRAVNDAEPPDADVRYDKVELTYPGVANLTAVDFFSIPFRLEAVDRRGRTHAKLTYSAPTDTIIHALLAIPGARRALISTSGGGFARVLSPQLKPLAYPRFGPYVHSMAGKRIVVRGAFYGVPFQRYVYSGVFARDGSITLHGAITADGHRMAGQALSVTGRSLAGSIYTVDGPYSWGGAVHHVADNDVYAAIYRDLIAGFAWGYWGGRYGNDSGNWLGKPPFAAARRARPRGAAYNEYAAVIYRYSNAYGFSFSDTGPKKVQLPVNQPTLRITILPDRPRRH